MVYHQPAYQPASRLEDPEPGSSAGEGACLPRPRRGGDPSGGVSKLGELGIWSGDPMD